MGHAQSVSGSHSQAFQVPNQQAVSQLGYQRSKVTAVRRMDQGEISENFVAGSKWGISDPGILKLAGQDMSASTISLLTLN